MNAVLNVHYFNPQLAPHAIVDAGHAIRPATTARTLAFRASIPVDVAHRAVTLAREILDAQRREQTSRARAWLGERRDLCARLGIEEPALSPRLLAHLG